MIIIPLQFPHNDIPACGYKTYKIKWAEKNIYPYPHEDWDVPRILSDNMLCGTNEAQNEYIRVKLNPDGTVNITDKETGKVYKNLNYLLDIGDKGNMWTYDNIPRDKMISTLGINADTAVSINGPLVVKFTVDYKLKLPKEYDFAKQLRSSELVEIPVHIEMTLKKGSRYLEVVTDIDNRAKDHYLKVCMPTGLNAEKTWAEGSFMVTEFPVKPSYDGEVRGNELARHPAQLWYDLADDNNGFAVLTDATKDYEILEDSEDKTIAMGLVRCTRLRIACDGRLWMEYPGDESSQSLRKFSYRYAFMPHTDKWDKAGLYNAGLAFNAPLKVCEFGKQEGIFDTDKSFVEIEGENLVLSSVTRSEEDTMLIRMYNPTEETINGRLNVGCDIKEAYAVKLDGSRKEKLEVSNGSITLSVGKGKIYTVEVV